MIIMFMMIILSSIFFAIFFIILPKVVLGNKKTKENLTNFINNTLKINGTLEECLIFSKDIASNNSVNSTEHIYYPIVKYLDKNNEYKLITCYPVKELKNIGRGVFRYKDLGKQIAINIDENQVKAIDLNLEEGVFLNEKNYRKIKIGDYAQARAGMFVKEENISTISLMEDEHILPEYLKKVKIAPGIITELNEQNYIEKNSKDINRILYLIGSICIIFSILMFLPMLFLTRSFGI